NLTALSVADAVRLERIDPLELKGKAHEVVAWRVIDIFPERSRERALGGLRAPMLGRGSELARLLRAFTVGYGRVLVVAPPGVGKTRLVDEFEVEAARSGALVLRARLRPDLLSPFEPVGQLLRSSGTREDLRERL